MSAYGKTVPPESGSAGDSEIFAGGMLRGKVALVTGGGTGLGRATALELARCGAAVTVAGRREEPLQETVAAIEALCPDGPGVQRLVGDVRERGQARELIGAVLERWGALDVLVNNAGGQYFTPAEGIATKGWAAVWRLNVDGMLNMAHEAHAQALGAAGGRVINITLSPHHGMPGMAHSGAARAAVEALTRELAASWAGAGITVCAVAAGHFDTEAMGKYPDVVRAGMARSVPLQRLGTVHEHAWLVALLASPLGAAFSGSTVTLDGARDNWFGPWPPPGLADSEGEVPTEERRGGSPAS
ncbi:MAG TPA: SDR family oxidoreductase [Solirubrobacteraceae bacterium]|jgi:citronellol/citronellal dehydrogenase